MKGTAEGGRVIIFIPDFWRRNVMWKSCYHVLMDRDVHVVMCSLTSKFVILLSFDWQVQQVMLNLTSRYLYTCKLPYCNEVIRYFDLIDRFNKLWNLTSHNNLFISKLWYFDGQVFLSCLTGSTSHWIDFQIQWNVNNIIDRYRSCGTWAIKIYKLFGLTGSALYKHVQWLCLNDVRKVYRCVYILMYGKVSVTVT